MGASRGPAQAMLCAALSSKVLHKCVLGEEGTWLVMVVMAVMAKAMS